MHLTEIPLKLVCYLTDQLIILYMHKSSCPALSLYKMMNELQYIEFGLKSRLMMRSTVCFFVGIASNI